MTSSTKAPADQRRLAALLERPELLLVVIGLPFGLLFAVLMPPFQPADEHPHFFRAYQITQGDLIPTRQGKDLGGLLPASLGASAEEFKYLFYHADRKVEDNLIATNLRRPLEPGRREFHDFKATAPYAPTTYLPAAAAIVVGRVLRLSPVGIMYLARIVCLAAYIALIAAAIRIMPVQKWPMFLVALAPAVLATCSSVSSDIVAVGAAFLFVAICLDLAWRPERIITRRELVLLFVAGFFVNLAKFAYAPLLLMVLLLPRRKFPSPRIYWRVLAAFLVGNALVYLGWSWAMLQLHAPKADNISATGQLLFILGHPLSYAGVICRTYWTRQLHLLFSAVGTLGHLDTVIPNVHFISCLFMLLFASLVEGDPDRKLPPYARRLCLLLLAFLLVFLPTLVYLNSVPVGESTVTDLGGRYFIPLAPIFFIVLYNHRIVSLSPRLLRLVYAGYTIVSLAMTTGVIVLRYYH